MTTEALGKHVLALQHVPFEGPARLRHWCAERGHALTIFPVYSGGPLPNPDSADLVAVLGGPMSVHDETQHSWLGPEKRWLGAALEDGRTVFGICLGAQMIAQVSGAEVRKNASREIGWFPIELEAARLPWPTDLPSRMNVMHWHGETFGIPRGMVRFASSDACTNQAFVSPDGRVMGLQCHLEWDRETAAALIENCGDELDGSTWVQNAGSILAGFSASDPAAHLWPLLDRMISRPAS